ncbi:MAG: hypothetical protein ACO1N0_01365 [Fluviicola sp.]
MNRLICFTFLICFSLKGFSQDTLVLKITNLEARYEPCMNHWFPCGTILTGKLTSSIAQNKTYTIHVLSVDVLNRLPRNASAIYQVIVRKRYSKSPFEESDEEEYSLIAIKSAF